MIDDAAAPGTDESDGPAGSPADGPAGSPVGAAPTLAERLLDLQRIDTEADQLRVRRERLTERDELAEQTKLISVWERRRTKMAERLQELSDMVDASEASGAALTTHRHRLEGQLKTVIAPREAEALMHEIATIDAERDALDDAELAALEEQAALDDELTAHLMQEESLRRALRQADGALEIAVTDIDAELDVLDARRGPAAAALDERALTRYESVRRSSGVAVAQLKGHRCEGCHLDLSAAEVDTAKDESAQSGFTDCPQCGRMLIV